MVLLTTFISVPNKGQGSTNRPGSAAAILFVLFFQRYSCKCHSSFYLPGCRIYLNLLFLLHTHLHCHPHPYSIPSSAFTPGNHSKILPGPHSILFIVCQFSPTGAFHSFNRSRPSGRSFSPYDTRTSGCRVTRCPTTPSIRIAPDSW